ncbi:metallophosphoesterase [Streptomyces sp. NPDC002643]
MHCCVSAPLSVLAVFAAQLGVAQARGPRDRAAAVRTVAAVNLELVTLTEDRAVITWFTGVPGSDDGSGRMLPAVTEGEVVYGTHPSRLNRTAYGAAPTAHHHIELTGLEPGQTYYYQARSQGTAALPTAMHLVRGNAVGTSRHGFGSRGGPYSFTTPEPPPGRHLMSIALCNDLHLGEITAGRLLTGIPLPRGVSQRLDLAPYPEIMARALVTEAHRRGADRLLAAGDISAGGAPADLAAAKRILDGFGTHGRDYFVVRGNHDRPRRHGLRGHRTDTFRAGFGPDPADPTGLGPSGPAPSGPHPSGLGPAYFAHDLGGLRIIGLDTYEKRGNGGDPGGLTSDQLSWLRGELRTNRDQPTLVFGHHPLTVRDSLFPVTRGQRLNRRQARAILDAYATTPGVFLHHAGHTHRNKHTVLPQAPHVTLQEVSAVKDYPGGFCLLRIHTGGYALNYYKIGGTPAAREWSERSRRVAAGLWPQYALGRSVHDRNTVTPHDFSGVTPPPPRPPGPPRPRPSAGGAA